MLSVGSSQQEHTEAAGLSGQDPVSVGGSGDEVPYNMGLCLSVCNKPLTT